MKKMMKRITGITMVELIMWLVILGIVASMVVQQALQQDKSLQVERGMFQMQEIFQSALMYRMHNNHTTWPPNLSTLIDAHLLAMNNNSGKNPWGHSYHIGTASGANDTEPFYFVIITNAETQQAAYRLAAALPNGRAETLANIRGTITIPYPNSALGNTAYNVTLFQPNLPSVDPVGGRRWVRAAITLPGENSQTATNMRVYGFVKNDSCVPRQNSCPPGTTAELMVIPVGAAGFSAFNPEGGTTPMGSIQQTGTSTEIYNIREYEYYTLYGAVGTKEPCHNTQSTTVPTQYCSQPSWRVCLLGKTDTGDIVYPQDFIDRNMHLLAVYYCRTS